MTPNEVKVLPLGLYILHWKEEDGGGWSQASVGHDAAGRHWFAATNWIGGVPCFDWTKVERAEFVDARPVPVKRDTVMSIQKEASAPLALYPIVNYAPTWHPYYWLGQRDAAKKIEAGVKAS